MLAIETEFKSLPVIAFAPTDDEDGASDGDVDEKDEMDEDGTDDLDTEDGLDEAEDDKDESLEG